MRDGEPGLGVWTDSERAEELSEPEVPLPWCSLCGSWGGTYSPTVAVAGNDCETFWDKDQLTDSCYQFNFQSTLSWREAWASCEQQGADLLSITEIHEQTYINGEVKGSLLWLSQKSGPCWGWGDTSSLGSAPAPTTSTWTLLAWEGQGGHFSVITLSTRAPHGLQLDTVDWP